jgi:hypothetical protein
MELLALMHIFDRDQIPVIFFSYEAKAPVAVNFSALLCYSALLQGQRLFDARLLRLGDHESHIFAEGSINIEITSVPN